VLNQILSVNKLNLRFPETNFHAVHDISFELYQGETLALVGQSGSGKTLTVLSILGLEPVNSYISGQILFKDTFLLNNSESLPSKNRKYPENIRGKHISLIPQDPLSALNPLMTIYQQLSEAYLIFNKKTSTQELEHLCISTLEQVGIADPTRCIKAYPHELSGGMRQRILIAMAIINNPDLIIADEPTTALDLTVQAIILELLKSLKRTMLFITHDMGVVAEVADRVIQMDSGKIVKSASVFDFSYN